MTSADPRLHLTFDDFRRFPADGDRHELIGGVHVVSPTPTTRHQTVATRLTAALFRAVEAAGLGRVFSAPTAVRLADEDGSISDVIVVLNAHVDRIRSWGIDGPPDLVVEVLSRSTRRVDEGLKRTRYEVGGVAEYWMVDPDHNLLHRLVLQADGFGEPTEHRDAVTLANSPAVTVDLTRIW